MGKLNKAYYQNEKYHFRYYRKSINHPFLVALVMEQEDDEGKILISGFNVTRSIEKVLKKPTKFIRIENPSPNDDAPSFICIDPIKNKPLKFFTRPIKDWKLSIEDQATIDELVKEKFH